MARVTRKAIEKAILEATGHVVEVNRLANCYWFFGEEISHCYGQTVAVYRLNHLTVDQWVRRYKELLEDKR